MKNFKLVGRFNNTLNVNAENNFEIIEVPLVNNNGVLNYGLEKVYKKLIENNNIPKEDALDILLLATLVYLADTRISRELHSQDSWTREIKLDIPVYNSKTFSKAIPVFEKMLCFLTGDKWTISISNRDAFITEEKDESIKENSIDVVTLFSGGMDSLISTINYLEQKENVMLVSHAGEGFTKNAQTNIISKFKNEYPDIEIFYLDLWMVFDQNFIKDGGNENSTRSRSFLFIALGIFAISGLDNVNTLQVPENGFIALNIPLDELRIGSHSTRTTHPFYLNCWNELLKIFDLDILVVNPYWNKTKGEMADECINKEFLKSTMSQSFFMFIA
ncbi:Qat anti-phage system QueC-like protein QatC [Clostridium perfringens]|uniref:Qat anti-phage system QueC-like protein QatC n=1 Tax=Clostridium perfringens TaxID=1502 RepID=UPI0039ED678C